MSAKDRLHPRAQAKIGVEFHFGSTVGVGFTNDVSEGGLFLESETLADPGTRVYMRLRLPGSAPESTLKVIGIVRRRVDVPDGADARGMGIRFEVAYRHARETLGGFMHEIIRDPELGLHTAPAPIDSERPPAPSLSGVEPTPPTPASAWIWGVGFVMLLVALLLFLP